VDEAVAPGGPIPGVARGDDEVRCSELEIIDALTGAIFTCRSLAMVATVIGFRANATATAVPSLSPWDRSAASSSDRNGSRLTSVVQTPS
jgi:hypothetical protein